MTYEYYRRLSMINNRKLVALNKLTFLHNVIQIKNQWNNFNSQYLF